MRVAITMAFLFQLTVASITDGASICSPCGVMNTAVRAIVDALVEDSKSMVKPVRTREWEKCRVDVLMACFKLTEGTCCGLDFNNKEQPPPENGSFLDRLMKIIRRDLSNQKSLEEEKARAKGEAFRYILTKLG